MKQKIKQLLSFVLVLAIVFSCQLPVWAEDMQEIEETVQVTDETSEATDEAVADTQEASSEDATDEENESATVVLDDIEKAEDKTILYVALDGNNSNAGTINAPLASIAGARDKIRALKASNALGKGGAVVYVREGNYIMNEGVTFRAEDSGTKDAPIVYRNYPDEEVNFIGGAYLRWEDFKPVKDEKVLSRIVDEDAREHIVSVDLHKLGYTNLPEPMLPGTYSYWAELGTLLKEKYGVEKPSTNSSELIIDGVGAVLARYPNDGDLLIGEVIKKGDFKQSDDPMEFVVDDPRVKNWTKAENAIISGTFTHSWAGQATFLDSVNEAKNSIRSKYPVWYGAVKDQHFYVFNLIEEIDMPGEYYIDIKDGILYLYAPDGGAEEIVYTLHTGTMFHVTGIFVRADAATGVWVANVDGVNMPSIPTVKVIIKPKTNEIISATVSDLIEGENVYYHWQYGRGKFFIKNEY